MCVCVERTEGERGDGQTCHSVFVVYENKSSPCTTAPAASAKSHQGNGMTSVTRLLCFYQLIVENDKGVRCMALAINDSNSLGLTAYEKPLLEKNHLAVQTQRDKPQPFTAPSLESPPSLMREMSFSAALGRQLTVTALLVKAM